MIALFFTSSVFSSWSYDYTAAAEQRWSDCGAGDAERQNSCWIRGSEEDKRRDIGEDEAFVSCWIFLVSFSIFKTFKSCFKLCKNF